MCASRSASDGAGSPPSASRRAPSTAAARSRSATACAGSASRASRFTAPTTSPKTRTGMHASASRPDVAATKAGSAVTSSSTAATPLLTTRPMTPVEVVKPSETWK